jgi:putative ABC transport system substrate-binding protein
MNRRHFIILLGGEAAAWPLAVRAQQPGPMRQIGVLMDLSLEDPEGRARYAALLQALATPGWVVGRNLTIERRSTTGDLEKIRKSAAELAALAPTSSL